MSELSLIEVKDFKDGEIQIRVCAGFTIFVPPMEKTEIMNRIKNEFNDVMMRYAI